MRRRIAVLAGQVDEATQTQFLKGFAKEAYKHDYDLCVFSLYQKYQEDWLREIGDSNIFELVNYKLFDAVVILLDTILTRNYTDKLQENVKSKFDGPVLVIDRDSKYFDSIMMDHYHPIYDIIEHLIVEHGYKDIAFLGGKEGHPHSVQRLNAFRDCLTNYGIPINENWIYHGNYWYDSAEIFADRLLRDRSHMPQAIACANDIMAIGLAQRLVDAGYKIPEDIAITGYDSIEDGRNAPAPLTSAPIPSKRCGEYAFNYLYAKIHGKEIPSFEPETEMILGESCGCKVEHELKQRRDTWNTQQSRRGLFSDFNHLIEDLMAQTSFKNFIAVIQRYLFQIRPFTHFDICLNEGFLNPENNIGEKSLRKGYATNVYRVLSCSDYFEGNEVNFNRHFKSEEMLPDLFDYRDYPTTYFFNPLFCDDRCFGYTVINFGEEIRSYSKEYRVWMRTVMQGLESFLRLQYLNQLIGKIQSSQVRDSLTGLYNYDGFIEQLMNHIKRSKHTVSIISLDLDAFRTINNKYGRDVGDKVINIVARLILDRTKDKDICSRISNDEFLIALEDDSEGTRTSELVKMIKDDVSSYKLAQVDNCKLVLHTANLVEEIKDQRELEALINRTIGLKNRKKIIKKQSNTDSNEEIMNQVRNSQIVERILNDNLFTYHYQPIVSAVDGSIYAYEALMRSEKEKISPLQIIEAAGYLDRLNEVEEATLLNVTSDVINRFDQFGDAKVFINSIPGYKLSEETELILNKRAMEHQSKFVIEVTEESEMDDDDLTSFKSKNNQVGTEIAIDDYGVGYSNIANLIRYTPKYVKVDRSLISDIHKNPQKQHFVKDIISYAHDNGIMVLAEGVELQEELKLVVEFGIDLIQGYYTGKPKHDPVQSIDEEIINSIKRYRMSFDDDKIRTFLT